MRFFPRASRRRVAVACLAAATVGGLAIPQADAGSGDTARLKQHQHHVAGKIAQSQVNLDDASVQLTNAEHALQAAQAAYQQATAAVTAANAKVAVAQAALAQAQQHLADVQAQLAQAQAQDEAMKAALAAAEHQLADAHAAVLTGQQAVEVQRAKARGTILNIAEGASPGLIAVSGLLTSKTPSDITRRQELDANLVSTQDNTFQGLQAAEAILAVKEQQQKQATAAVAVQRKAAAQHLKEVQALEQEAQAASDAVAASVAAAQQAAAAATAAQAQASAAQQAAAAAEHHAEVVKNHDVGLLKALQQEEERIKLKILLQARHDPNRDVSSTSGMFMAPVANSYVTSPYGWRIHPIYHYWGLHNGDDFHAPCGVPEVAVETGRVTDEYYSDVWGNRLYLDLGNINGHNYTAIYNHISQYVVHTGAIVGRGQTLALAGTTGWSTACHLHFTIMKDGVAIDPQTVL